MRTRAGRLAAAALLTLAAGACAPPALQLPSGTGTAAPDAAAVLADATAACRNLRTLTAEIAISGRLHGQRVRGRLAAGFAAPASARIEAVAPFGAPLFVFVASGSRASLLLPRADRYITDAPPATLLDAVAGVPFGPAELQAIVSGCGAADRELTGARRYGDDWMMAVVGADRRFYLKRSGTSSAWRLVAAIVAGADPVRIEYRDFQNGLPRSVRLVASQTVPGTPSYDLTLALSQVDLNTPIPADAFNVRIPKTAQPITVDELRRDGPLADRRDTR